MSADMEGGLARWRAVVAFDPAYWREGVRRWRRGRSAARGLLAGRADEVVVFDNHAVGTRSTSVPVSAGGARLETWNMFDVRERGIDAASGGVPLARELDAFFRTVTRRSWCSTWMGANRRSRSRAWAGTSPCSGSAVTRFTLKRSVRSKVHYLVTQPRRRRWTPALQRHSMRSSALRRGRRAGAASR
jgi:hypothetical protein